MLDIETMGTHTSLSLILSVGMISFELKKEAPVFGVDFIRVLAMEPQILKGRLIEPGTQEWWSKQTKEARDHWENPRNKIYPNLLSKEIVDYVSLSGGNPSTQIWANGVVFDIGNLEQLFRQFNTEIPWKYNSVCDARTQYRNPKLRSMPSTLAFEGHDPVEDCRKQIWRLWEHAPEEWLV